MWKWIVVACILGSSLSYCEEVQESEGEYEELDEDELILEEERS